MSFSAGCRAWLYRDAGAQILALRTLVCPLPKGQGRERERETDPGIQARKGKNVQVN